MLAHALLTIKPVQDKSMKLQALKTARGSSTLQAQRTAGKIESSVQHSGKNLWLNNRLAVADHAFAFQQLEYELYLPVGTVLKTDLYITQMLNRAQNEEVFAEGTTYLVTPKGLVCMDCAATPVDAEEDEDEMEEEIDIELGTSETESGGKEARHMRIRVKDDDLRLRKTRSEQQPSNKDNTAGWSQAR